MTRIEDSDTKVTIDSSSANFTVHLPTSLKLGRKVLGLNLACKAEASLELKERHLTRVCIREFPGTEEETI